MKITLTLIATLLALVDAQSAPVRVVLVGDSTMANWPASIARRGWGQFAQEFFTGDALVINHGVSGASTKTFINNGFWLKALNDKPNFVLIQFGHNDSHGPGKPESTDVATGYKDYLRCFIDDTRSAGATPVLITPMCRRSWGPDGKLIDGLLPYAAAMKEIAAERKVALVDLNASSFRYFEQLGEQKSALLGDGTPDDRTHFNEKGARAMAELVMKELPQAVPALQKYLKEKPAAAGTGNP